MQKPVSIAALIAALVLSTQPMAQTISVKAADCAALVRHAAAGGVAFVPGDDLQGRLRTSVDAGAAERIEPPREFAIPLTVDLQQRLGIPVDPTEFQAQNFSVGTVIWKNGTGYFNGQPLQNDQSIVFAALCRKKLGANR